MNGLVKTMDDGNGGKIKLVGNALTFILYKSYFGRDLLNDIVAFAAKSADAGTVKRFSELNIKTVADMANLSESEQMELLTVGLRMKCQATTLIVLIWSKSSKR